LLLPGGRVQRSALEGLVSQVMSPKLRILLRNFTD
jgi:hypothetical protein